MLVVKASCNRQFKRAGPDGQKPSAYRRWACGLEHLMFKMPSQHAFMSTSCQSSLCHSCSGESSQHPE